MWYSSGRDLTKTTKYQHLANGSLEITHVTEQDAGEYECTASNKLGRKTVVRSLKVISTFTNKLLRTSITKEQIWLRNSGPRLTSVADVNMEGAKETTTWMEMKGYRGKGRNVPPFPPTLSLSLPASYCLHMVRKVDPDA